jgi:cold shock CspA family protein
MSKNQQTWLKKEKEQKRLKKRENKEKKKVSRRANAVGGGFEDMIAYVDENGNISASPPDLTKKEKIKAENIEIGIPRQESGVARDNKREGRLAFFNESKGYGFIHETGTRQSIFVHINDIIEPVKENELVVFQVEKGKRGLTAVNVKPKS